MKYFIEIEERGGWGQVWKQTYDSVRAALDAFDSDAPDDVGECRIVDSEGKVHVTLHSVANPRGAKKKDPFDIRLQAKEYQVVVGGETKLASDLTHEQALEALMNAIDAIEKIAEHSAGASEVIEKFLETGLPV